MVPIYTYSTHVHLYALAHGAALLQSAKASTRARNNDNI